MQASKLWNPQIPQQRKHKNVSATMAATIKAEDRTLLDLCRGSKIANARLPHKVPVFLIFLPNSQMSGQFTTLAMQSLSKAYWKHIAVAKRQAEVATEQIGLRSAARLYLLTNLPHESNTENTSHM